VTSICARRAFIHVVAEESIAAESSIADARKRPESVHAFAIIRAFCTQVQTLVNICALKAVSDEAFVAGAFERSIRVDAFSVVGTVVRSS